MRTVEQLIKFIDKSYTPFHVTENIKNMLLEAGFEYISSDLEKLELGKKYFTIYNDSALVAFITPNTTSNNEIHIVASHNDSPTFKLKPNYLLQDANYVRFNTEPYGGAIYSSFMDKVLGIAGRVIYLEEGSLKTKLVNLPDSVIIPNVAIHMNREVNNGFVYNPQIDLLPLLSASLDKSTTLNKIIAKEIKVKEEAILSFDLFLYPNRSAGSFY